MKPRKPLSAKIIEHSHGLGAPTADSVRKRAVELAHIEGRKEASEEDWKRAKQELHGGHTGAVEAEEAEMIASSSARDMLVGGLGHHTENLIPEGTDSLGEELVSEGLDEAEHEQMLEASRLESEEEEEESA
jgi:hypothetical protein